MRPARIGKEILKRVLLACGIEVERGILYLPRTPGAAGRPIGRLRSFLEDLRARGFAPRGIIDIGANQGLWTMTARRVFPSVPTIMIEPLDEMSERLTYVARQLPVCNYIKAGVGPSAAELPLTVTDDLSGSTFLDGTSTDLQSTGRRRMTKIVTLDSILGDSPGFQPDLVKLDIQGYELEALRGGESLFGRTEVFILETSLYSFWPKQPTTRDCIEFMHERGYVLYEITDWLRRSSDGALGQVDLAFVRTDGRLRQSNRW